MGRIIGWHEILILENGQREPCVKIWYFATGYFYGYNVMSVIETLYRVCHY
jgi:hypothetical protein